MKWTLVTPDGPIEQESEFVEIPKVSSYEATERAGFPHPGNRIELSAGHEIPVQYGCAPTQERNGYFPTEIIDALIDHHKVYQEGSMSDPNTARALRLLAEARDAFNQRQIDRAKRNVRFTNKP